VTAWSFTPADAPDTPRGFVATLRSFGSTHHQAIGHLAAVLMPRSSFDDEALADWILRALNAGLPERLRLIVVDSLEHPRFGRLDPQADARIARRRPAIDALSTAQETFAQETTTGPAGVFRNLLMGVVVLMEKGTADQVRARALDALSFARKQHWADQEVVLRIMVAGALLKESRHAEAIKVYQVARQAAERALDASHPAGRKLALQAWFGEAGAHLAAGDVPAAAECYDTAAQVAMHDRNPLMTLEAFRMGAFCHARDGDREGAIERGLCALEVGARLDRAARPMTTLPVAAVDLLRVVEPARVQQLEQVKARLHHAIGDAHAQAESAAADMEHGADPIATARVQSQLETDVEQAHARAELELEAIVAEGSAEWSGHFEQARQLLGTDWPMRSELALPVTTTAVPETAQAAAEASAS